MTSELTDQSVYQITQLLYKQFMEQELEKKLDPDHLSQFKREHIKPLYPHKEIPLKNGATKIQKFDCHQYCCELTPGRFLCCDTTEPDRVYNEFGLGICIYSKFMKHLVFLLIFVSILSLLSILLYYMIAVFTDYPLLSSYQDFLFSGSIGIISSSYSKCNYDIIEAQQGQFIMTCPVGTVNLIGPTFTNKTKDNVENCRIQRQNFQLDQYVPPSYVQKSNCSLGYECEVDIALTQLTHPDSNSHQYKYISYNFECLDAKYPIGQINFTDEIVTYIVVGIDYFIIFLFMIFMISEHRSEKKEVENFKQKKLALDDFSVKISGFKQGRLLKQLDEFISYYNDDILKKKTKLKKGEEMQWDLYSDIVQIKLNETQEFCESVEKRRKAYQKLYDLLDQSFFDEEIDVRKYTTSEQFIKKCYGSPEALPYIEYKTALATLLSNFKQSKKIHYYSDSHRNQKTSVIMVLSNPRAKRKMLKNTHKKCFNNQITINDVKYSVEEAPVADMILWENQYKWTCCRIIIFWLITLILCFGSYLLVGFAQYQKDLLGENNNFNQDCQVLFLTTEVESFDEGLLNQKSYLHCYCYEQLFNLGLQIQDRCTEWIYNYALYLAIPILISIGIVVYNIIISRLFKLFSKLQAHDQITSQLFSYTVKRTFVLILNMGLVMILVNLHYPGRLDTIQLQFLFNGTYEDITADWYFNIGVVITLTLCFNILMPIIEVMVVSLFKCLRRMWDTSCCRKPTSKKTKKQFIELYSGDVFPIEQRYADLLSIIAITLTFSAVIPILYIIALISLGFMTLCDKLLLFRIFQKPKNFDSSLHDKVFRLVIFFLVVHCVISPLLLSAPGLMQASGVLSIDLLFETGSTRMNLIFRSGYLIPYVVLFLLFVLWIIIYISLFQVCSFCIEQCTSKLKIFHQTKLNAKFLMTLNTYQLNKLKFSVERLITMVEGLTKAANQHQINLTEDNLMESVSKKYLIQSIAEQTLKEIQKLAQIPTKTRMESHSSVSLIGKAGYDQIFDDQVLYRDKKIKQLDSHIKAFERQNNKSQSREAMSPPQNLNIEGETFVELVVD